MYKTILDVNVVDLRINCIQQQKFSYAVSFIQGLLDLMDCLATMDQMESQVYQDKRENQE